MRNEQDFAPRTRRISRGTLAAMVAIAGLVPPVTVGVTGSGARAAAGPTDTTMWSLYENAVINNDPSPAANQVVRLTPASTYKKGYAVYKPTIPATQSVDITFNMAHWGGSGRDGIAFFVKDARDTTTSFGAVGHPLGYGTRSGVDGLSGALLGIGFGAGFDASDVDGTGCSYSSTPARIPISDADRDHTISLRGGPGYGGNRRSNYCLLADPVTVQSIAPFNASYTSRASAARTARITIDAQTASSPRIKVYYGATESSMSEVFDVPVPSSFAGVENLRIGFSGATGAATNNHEVWGLTSVSESYELQFDGQGGTLSSTSATYTKSSGSSPQALPTVSPRPGYEFLGWYSESTAGTKIADAADSTFTPTGPGTLYARWAPLRTVTFKANGGQGSDTTDEAAVAGALPTNPFTRPGHSFAGWGTSPEGPVVYADGATFPFDADVTLYALWTAWPVVTFDPNFDGGEAVTQSSGAAVELRRNTFQRDGYEFTGWNTAADGSGTSYADGASFAFQGSATLYAQWAAIGETPADGSADASTDGLANGGRNALPLSTFACALLAIGASLLSIRARRAATRS